MKQMPSPDCLLQESRESTESAHRGSERRRSSEHFSIERPGLGWTVGFQRLKGGNLWHSPVRPPAGTWSPMAQNRRVSATADLGWPPDTAGGVLNDTAPHRSVFVSAPITVPINPIPTAPPAKASPREQK